MIVENEFIRVVNLKLTPIEASWLKSIMQNPLWGQNPNEEDSFDKDMRSRFFHSLVWV